MIEETFSHGSSLLHGQDCRGKIIAVVVFIGVVATTASYLTSGAALLVALLMVIWARLDLVTVVKRLLLVNSLTLLLWLILPLTYGGADNLLLWDTVKISMAGVKTAGLITLKTNAIVLYIVAFLTTSSVVEVNRGLQSLGLPDKLSFLLLFSSRHILVLVDEYQRLLRAARMRNFSPATNLHTYKTYGYLFGMTLVKSWDKGEKIHEAMLLRGFHGKFHSLKQPEMTSKDYLFLGCTLLIVSGLFSLNFM